MANWSNAGHVNEHFRNNGDGTFSEIAAAIGVDSSANYTGVSHGDFDGDGDQDLYLSNIGQDGLYLNDGGDFSSNVRSAMAIGGHHSDISVPSWAILMAMETSTFTPSIAPTNCIVITPILRWTLT